MTKVIYLIDTTNTKNPKCIRGQRRFGFPFEAQEFAEKVVEQAISSGALYFVHIQEEND